MQFVVLRTKNFQCWKFVCHNGISGRRERRREGGELKTVNFMHPHVLSHWAIVESWTKTIKSILFKIPPHITFEAKFVCCCDVKCGWTKVERRREKVVHGMRSEIFSGFDRQSESENYVCVQIPWNTMRLIQVRGDNLLHGMQL